MGSSICLPSAFMSNATNTSLTCLPVTLKCKGGWSPKQSIGLLWPSHGGGASSKIQPISTTTGGHFTTQPTTTHTNCKGWTPAPSWIPNCWVANSWTATASGGKQNSHELANLATNRKGNCHCMSNFQVPNLLQLHARTRARMAAVTLAPPAVIYGKPGKVTLIVLALASNAAAKTRHWRSLAHNYVCHLVATDGVCVGFTNGTSAIATTQTRLAHL